LKLVALQILQENKDYDQVVKRWKKIVILTLRVYYLPFKQIKKLLRRNDVHENENERLSKFTPEHLSLPPVFSGVRVSRSLVLYVCFVDRCLSFCTFFLAIVLTVLLRYTDSDCPFGIFKIFLHKSKKRNSANIAKIE